MPSVSPVRLFNLTPAQVPLRPGNYTIQIRMRQNLIVSQLTILPGVKSQFILMASSLVRTTWKRVESY